MQEHDDYADDDPERGHSSPLLTLALLVVVPAGLVLFAYLALFSLAYLVAGIPE